MIELCCEYLSALYVIMSCTSFRMNLLSIVCLNVKELRCCHLNSRYRNCFECFEQGVMWHNNDIQSINFNTMATIWNGQERNQWLGWAVLEANGDIMTLFRSSRSKILFFTIVKAVRLWSCFLKGSMGILMALRPTSKLFSKLQRVKNHLGRTWWILTLPLFYVWFKFF